MRDAEVGVALGGGMSLPRRSARIALIVAVGVLAALSVVSVVVFAHPETFGFLVIVAAVVLFMSVVALLVSVVTLVVSLTGVVTSHGGAIALLVIGLVCCGVAALAMVAAVLFLLPLFFP